MLANAVRLSSWFNATEEAALKKKKKKNYELNNFGHC